jgi:branched-chain amino acid aminotransferase
MNNQSLCWINGKITAPAEARISVFDHGLLYGDGIFEGLRFYNKSIFRRTLHLQRLQDSASALRLNIPLEIPALEKTIDELLTASPLDHGYLRIIVTRGVGTLGIDPTHCPQPGLILIADELQMVDEEQRSRGIRTIIAATRRPAPDQLDPRIKSLNYLNAIMARMEAHHAGVEEAILLNQQGHVAEGTVDNLFIVRRGELLTPATTEGALAGITRMTILELAKAADIPAKETVLTPYDLYTADECFLTGTGARLIPVREIDGREISECPGRIYNQLATAYSKQVAQETD